MIFMALIMFKEALMRVLAHILSLLLVTILVSNLPKLILLILAKNNSNMVKTGCVSLNDYT